ncbi:MAG: cytochrome b N-terminal domain-containing protein [Micrococcales bacterium]|nr:cytochrome b N-terminal domain-containing protein [Micrococcales bacterium]
MRSAPICSLWPCWSASRAAPRPTICRSGWLRIAQGIMSPSRWWARTSTSFKCSVASSGTDFISRLYAVHILLVPGLIPALLTAHLIMVWYREAHAVPGPWPHERQRRRLPAPTDLHGEAGGFFVVARHHHPDLGPVTINPIWLYGPYTPPVTAGAQPDWYIGFLEGALRMMPNVEWVIFGYTISWNILVPAAILPGILFTVMGLYPWIEQWATGDKSEHHLLDRPRNAPSALHSVPWPFRSTSCCGSVVATT